MVAPSASGSSTNMGDGPQMIRTISLKMRMRPKVHSTWSRCEHRYSLPRKARSISRPSTRLNNKASATPTRKEPLRAVATAPTYAPVMYSEPCARLRKLMMPKTRVRPADSRNSSAPSCTLLSTCTANRLQFTRGAPRAARGEDGSRAPFLSAALLQRTLIRVAVTHRLHGCRDGLHVHAALRVLVGLEDVHVLNRKVIVSELEFAAHRVEVGRFESRLERLLVGDAALDLGKRRVEQLSRVVGLRGILRRNALVAGFEVGHEFLAGGILEVRSPERAIHRAGSAFALRRQIDAFGRRRIQQRDGSEARLSVLLDEVDTQSARVEDVNGIRFGGLDLRDLG